VSVTSLPSQVEPARGRGETRPAAGTLAGTLRAAGLRAGRQLAGSLGVIFSVITATFLITRVFAPDPTTLFLARTGNGFVNAAAAAAERAKVRASLGLDKPLIVQFYRFVVHLLHGDLGISFQTGRAVTADLADRLPATLELAAYALIFGIILGVVAGVISAVRRDGLFDRVTGLLTVGGLSLPQFWIGLMLLLIFFTELHIAPGPVGRLPIGAMPPQTITGLYTVDGLLTGDWSTALNAARQLVLPVFALGIGLAAPICTIVRSSMVEALSSDYVRTATAMGFGRRRIHLVYALKNGLLPVVTVLAGIIAYTFVGSVLIEGIFGWPGVGNYALQAIQTSDFPAIQGFVLYAAIIYVVIFELLNFAYGFVDPRIRT